MSPRAPASAICAGSGSQLAAYSTSFNNQLHVIFVGSDKHVHEFVYVDHWYHNDLTQAAHAPEAVPDTPLTGYESAWNEQQLVMFIGTDRHVYELVYGGRWDCYDLTTNSGGPAAPAGSPLFGYTTDNNKQQHVLYLTGDGHIHEMVYGHRWDPHDLSKDSWNGARLAMSKSALVGHQVSFSKAGYQQAACYVGNDGHLIHFAYDKSGWWTSGLTGGSAVKPAPGTALVGFQTEDNRQIHVIYVGTDKHVHEMVWCEAGWTPNDLTVASGAGCEAAVGRLAGFSDGEEQLLAYLGTDGHLNQLLYYPPTHQWIPKDLTKDFKIDPPIAGSPLAAFKATIEGTAGWNVGLIGKSHWWIFVYLGTDNHIMSLDDSVHDLTTSYR
jgi:hypothetical protein